MSPLSLWRRIPTTLDLNGPSLEFTTQPTGVTTTIGLAVTFTGIATVSFPAGYAIEGNIAYQWYNSTDGSAVEDGNRSNSRGGITTFSGAGTTSLVIQNVQYYEDHADEYYLEADFKPVGYWQPGNESPNPNAINDKLNSDTVQLLVPSRLEIVSQPQPELDANSAIFANFNITATLTDPSLNALIQYQWKLDGNNLSDDDDTVGAKSPNLKIKRSNGTYTLTCEVSHGDALPSPILSDAVTYKTTSPANTIYSQLVQSHGGVPDAVETTSANLSLGPINLVGREVERSGRNATKLNFLYSPNKDIDVLLEIAGAGGGSYSGNRGGRGGWGLFKLSMQQNVEYLIKLGSNDATYGPWGGLISGNVRGTTGGGAAFFYRQNRTIVVMGGGGGAGENGRGGDGGGANQNGEDGGGRRSGAGGVGGPSGRGVDNFSANRSGQPTAACISPTNDYFRDQGLSDCEAYSPSTLSQFRKANAGGRTVSNTASLYRGWRQGNAGRVNGGWGISEGGAGGGGARGGNGADGNGSGGGGGSGWADAGAVDILESRVGINADHAYMRISLYDPQAALPLPPEVTAAQYVSILWDNSSALGYRTGDPDNIGGSNQTVDGTIVYGPQGNITTGITTSPPTDYAPLFSGYRSGVGGNGIYFNPSDYVDEDNQTKAFGLSYIDFKLYIQDYGPVGGDNINYLLTNRGNRDASKGTVRKWYTEDASQVGDLYTTDKNEAFVPFTVEFEVAFACAEGGNYRVLYMTKTYEYTTFDQTHDIEFNSADLASQNNITGSNVDGNKLIFPDYSQYNYEDPRIVYMRSTIINNDLDDDNINTINMYAVASSNTTTTGTGNYLEFGRYLDDGQLPTGISPTVIPTGATQTVTFSASRSAADSNTVTWTKQNNYTGPHTMTFGPNGGSQSFVIESGAEYLMTNRTYSGGRGLNFRLSGTQTVQFDDVGDNDYNDLVVSCDKGTFSQRGKIWTASGSGFE